MPIVSIAMIVEVNQLLREKGIPFKIHLSDACGRQSMWVEPLGGEASPERYAEFYKTAEAYFEGQRMRLAYSPDRHTFWTAD